jgi:hypothetical protein
VSSERTSTKRNKLILPTWAEAAIDLALWQHSAYQLPPSRHTLCINVICKQVTHFLGRSGLRENSRYEPDRPLFCLWITSSAQMIGQTFQQVTWCWGIFTLPMTPSPSNIGAENTKYASRNSATSYNKYRCTNNSEFINGPISTHEKCPGLISKVWYCRVRFIHTLRRSLPYSVIFRQLTT